MGRVADDLRLLDLVWSEDLLAEARRSLVREEGAHRGGCDALGRLSTAELPRRRTDVTGAAGRGCRARSPMIPMIIMSVRLRLLRAPAISSPTTAVTCARRFEVTESRSPRQTRFSPPPSTATPEGFLELIELQAGGWAGGRPISELLAAIERAGAERFAGKVRASPRPLSASAGDWNRPR